MKKAKRKRCYDCKYFVTKRKTVDYNKLEIGDCNLIKKRQANKFRKTGCAYFEIRKEAK